MKLKTVISGAVGLALGAVATGAAADQKWTCDVTLYGLAAGMSGDIAVGPVATDLDVGFDQIWDNLEFGAMGKVRVGYERWALSTDVIYMGLGGSKNGVSAEMDQWVVEPTLGFSFSKQFELLAGVRYNNLNGDIVGTGPLGITRAVAGTQEWWDPIVGANVSLPLGEKFSFNFRGDVGGFNVGSDLTWQAFPFLTWHGSEAFSVQAGYRWVYTDYETGSGASRFKYDILTQGPQVGFTVHF